MSFKEYLIANHPGQNDNNAATVALLMVAAEGYADIEADEMARTANLTMLKAMLENDSISQENYNYYYQKHCAK